MAAFHWGSLLEPVIRQEYADRTKRIVRVPGAMLHHPRYQFVIAHVDGVTDDKRLFEAKTSRTSLDWGPSGSDQVPEHYLLQVQHYLAIVGYAVADVAVLIGGSDFRMYEIEADAELQEMILWGENDFWNHVQAGTPPDPDFERTDTVEILRRLYPGTNGKTVTADEEADQYRRVFENASEMVKNYTKAAEGARAHLLHHMGEASRLIFSDAGLQLQRKLSQRKQYTVPASSRIDSRFAKIKEIA